MDPRRIEAGIREKLTALLSMSCSACFFIQLRTTCLGVKPLTVNRSLLQKSNKRKVYGLAYRQSYGSILLVGVLLPR